MAHIHADGESYYLDQLCLIALSGAFGAVCLALYFWNNSMLKLMLGAQFHLWVLASGVVLVLIAVVRGSLLWSAVGARKHVHSHADHLHDHVHDETCAHNHDHAHDHDHHHHDGPCPDHDHGHTHHHHHHGHEHEHDHDHDHGWAPWRYVVLLIPIMLFLIGLPNKGPQVRAAAVHVDLTQEWIGYAMLIESGGDLWRQAVIAAALTSESSAPVGTLDFKMLEHISRNEKEREYWNGKTIKVIGQFARNPSSDRVFSLVRFKIRCCAADAIPLNVPIVCKESVSDIKSDQWVVVIGRVQFQQGPNGYRTVLLVPSRKAIVPTNPDPNPWVN